jgi:hypothetical protein
MHTITYIYDCCGSRRPFEVSYTVEQPDRGNGYEGCVEVVSAKDMSDPNARNYDRWPATQQEDFASEFEDWLNEQE